MGEELSTLPALLSSENIKKKFRDVLGENAAGFMSSILSAVNANPKLKKADPMSVISAAAVAAALDLPINQSLAFSYIVPYKDIAQFQMGWKGYVQLAQRTGLYLTINVSRVCEGELISENPFTGETNLSHTARASDKVIGYVAYFKLLNGFEKYLYMTKEQCEKHGKRYSDSYKQDWSWWQKDFDVMALKTVIKALLSKWGPLSIKMQLALQADQASIKEDGSYVYSEHEEEKESHKGIKRLKIALGTMEDEQAPTPEDLKIKAEAPTLEDLKIKAEAPQHKKELSNAIEGKAPMPYNGRTVVGIKSVTSETGVTNGKTWTQYFITTSENETLPTFDKKIAELAEKAKVVDFGVIISTETKGKYTNIVGMERMPDPGFEIDLEDAGELS